jgi:phage baseplate assembly protein W
MGNINLSQLTNTQVSGSGFKYADLNLDISSQNTKTDYLNSNYSNNDLKAQYNLGAIQNSIRNIFVTFPGQKLLNPTFGLNLMQFLFLPISDITANLIGQRILNGIIQNEPRVNVKKIRVEAITDENRYVVTLMLTIPFINTFTVFTLKGALNNTGFNFYNF